MICGGDPFYLQFWSEIADFLSVFARSDSAVTPSEKVQHKMPSARCYEPKMSVSPQSVAPKRKMSEICTISCDNSETVRDRMSVTINHWLEIAYGLFRLVPTSMTLNDLERCNSPYFAFFPPNSTDFQADYITVVEDIMWVKYCLPVPVFYFWRKL